MLCPEQRPKYVFEHTDVHAKGGACLDIGEPWDTGANKASSLGLTCSLHPWFGCPICDHLHLPLDLGVPPAQAQVCTCRPWGSRHEAFWTGIPREPERVLGAGTPCDSGNSSPLGEGCGWHCGAHSWSPSCPVLRVVLIREHLAVKTWAAKAT